MVWSSTFTLKERLIKENDKNEGAPDITEQGNKKNFWKVQQQQSTWHVS